jgi:hypothetical protein
VSSSREEGGSGDWSVDEPVALRPRALLAVVGRVPLVAAAPAPAAAPVVPGVVVAPLGEGALVGGCRRGAAVPVGAEVVVLVADEQQRPVAVAHLLVAVHRRRRRSLRKRTHCTHTTRVNASRGINEIPKPHRNSAYRSVPFIPDATVILERPRD